MSNPMEDIRHSGCGYERGARDAYIIPEIVKKLHKALKSHQDEFDGIVISGYSASLIGPIIAYKMKKHVAVVSKESETRHSSYICEGYHHQRWLFIDDLVSSGRTLKRVVDGVKEIEGSVVGVALYMTPGNMSEVCYYDNLNSSKANKLPCWCSFYAHDLKPSVVRVKRKKP